MATAEWVAWYNRERPNIHCCNLTPDRADELHTLKLSPANRRELSRNEATGHAGTDQSSRPGRCV